MAADCGKNAWEDSQRREELLELSLEQKVVSQGSYKEGSSSPSISGSCLQAASSQSLHGTRELLRQMDSPWEGSLDPPAICNHRTEPKWQTNSLFQRYQAPICHGLEDFALEGGDCFLDAELDQFYKLRKKEMKKENRTVPNYADAKTWKGMKIHLLANRIYRVGKSGKS
uniref:Uncharacterized protein n=1 Tax=Nymphaea colorata TaxID=210225 RepID=A0A5K1G1L2_9MAGN